MGHMAFFIYMDSRYLAAVQFLKNKAQKMPIVQAVSQKSIRPIGNAFLNAGDSISKSAINGQMLPAGRMKMGSRSWNEATSTTNPKNILMAKEFERDARNYKLKEMKKIAQEKASAIKKISMRDSFIENRAPKFRGDDNLLKMYFSMINK